MFPSPKFLCVIFHIAEQTEIREQIKLAKSRILHDSLFNIDRVFWRHLSLLSCGIAIEKFSVLKIKPKKWIDFAGVRLLLHLLMMKPKEVKSFTVMLTFSLH